MRKVLYKGNEYWFHGLKEDAVYIESMEGELYLVCAKDMRFISPPSENHVNMLKEIVKSIKVLSDQIETSTHRIDVICGINEKLQDNFNNQGILISDLQNRITDIESIHKAYLNESN